jgi:hypothetical protein
MAGLLSMIAGWCATPIEEALDLEEELGLSARPEAATHSILDGRTNSDTFTSDEITAIYDTFSNGHLVDLRNFVELQKELLAHTFEEPDARRAYTAFITLTSIHTPSIMEPLRRTGLPAIRSYQAPEARGAATGRVPTPSPYHKAVKNYIAQEIAAGIRSVLPRETPPLRRDTRVAEASQATPMLTPAEAIRPSPAEIMARSLPLLSLYIAQHPTQGPATSGLSGALTGSILAAPGYRSDITKGLAKEIEAVSAPGYPFPFIRSLLSLTALKSASGDVKIYTTADPTLEKMAAGGRSTVGVFFPERQHILFASMDVRRTRIFSPKETLATLAHEATHYATEVLFDSLIPSKVPLRDNTDLRDVIAEAKDAALLLRRHSHSPKARRLNTILSLFNGDNYSQDDSTYAIELLPRIPETVINHGIEGLRALHQYLPKLLQYWDKHFTPALQEHLRHATSSIAVREESSLLNIALEQARAQIGAPDILIPAIETEASLPARAERAMAASARASEATAEEQVLSPLSNSLYAASCFFDLGRKPEAQQAVEACMAVPGVLSKLSESKALKFALRYHIPIEDILRTYEENPTQFKDFLRPEIAYLIREQGATLPLLQKIHSAFPDSFDDHVAILATRKGQNALERLEVTPDDYPRLRHIPADALSALIDNAYYITIQNGKAAIEGLIRIAEEEEVSRNRSLLAGEAYVSSGSCFSGDEDLHEHRSESEDHQDPASSLEGSSIRPALPGTVVERSIAL